MEFSSILSLNGTCFSTIKWRLTDCCNYNCSYCVRKYLMANKLDMNFKEDKLKVMRSVNEVARIIKELPGNVKLDLIGGEVSLFDLHSILDDLFKSCGSKLYRVNITTNMSESAEYYNDLTQLCYSYGSEIGITCSWHSDFVSLEDFIAKFSQIKSPTNQKGIRIECVSREDNQEDVKKLIRICDDNNFTYFIEKDINFINYANMELINVSSKAKKPRYKVVYEDGTERLFGSRNEFLAKDNENFLVSTLKSYYCTRDYNYVYIEKDMHRGRSTGKEFCHEVVPIEDFHPLKEPVKCACNQCSMCGQISISKDKSLLVKE